MWLTSSLVAHRNLSQLTVEGVLGEDAGVHMWSQRTKGPLPALPPVVDDNFADVVEQVQLYRTHGPVRNDEGAGFDPRGLEQRCRFRQPGSLDDDVGVDDTCLPVVSGHNGLSEVAAQSLGEGVARLRSSRVHADLVEVEERVEQPDVPVRRPTSADVAEHPR